MLYIFIVRLWCYRTNSILSHHACDVDLELANSHLSPEVLCPKGMRVMANSAVSIM